MRRARASESKTPTPTPHLDHHRRDSLPAEDPSSADRELALVVLQDAHGPEGVLARVVDALEEAADLVHDDEVDGVLVDVPGFFFRVFRGFFFRELFVSSKSFPKLFPGAKRNETELDLLASPSSSPLCCFQKKKRSKTLSKKEERKVSYL